MVHGPLNTTLSYIVPTRYAFLMFTDDNDSFVPPSWRERAAAVDDYMAAACVAGALLYGLACGLVGWIKG